ncbi:MAG: hypothetical protein ACK55I_29780, partial [bacterium]
MFVGNAAALGHGCEHEGRGMIALLGKDHALLAVGHKFLFAPEWFLRRNHGPEGGVRCLPVQFERTGPAREHRLGPPQAAGHAVLRVESSGHVAQDAGGESELHGAQHSVVARRDARRGEEGTQQRCVG